MSILGRLSRLEGSRRSDVRILWFTLIVSLSARAFAGPQPLVLFFGGYGTNAKDMRQWKAAARDHPIYGPRFAFEAVPFPSDTTADETVAVEVGAAMIRRVAIWLVSTPNRKVTLVGHSSGAALAAAVLTHLRESRDVKLIVLDDGLAVGLKPPVGFDARTQFECWSATSGRLASINRKETRALCKNYHELSAPKCRTAVCLHFWLVNKHAPLALDYRASRRPNPTGSTAGYQDFEINLEWLRDAR